MIKRVFLFVLVNILVILTLNITLTLLGVPQYLSAQGIDYVSLLVFCSVFGFGGAFISLLISKTMAKWMMGVQIIDPQRATGETKELVQMVHRHAQKAGLPAMPEVGIYRSPEVNAFATGPSRGNALVAVSSGLLESMDGQAVEGVIGHEVSHIANGDMVTMTLLQGVVNTFVMFFSRVAAWALSSAMQGDRDERRGPNPMMYWITTMVFEVAFSLLGMLVVNYFSRRREYRADYGGAKLAGKEKMVHALKALKSRYEVDTSHPALSTLKINGKRGGVMALLATHPNLDDRIAALQKTPF